ncbi:oligosaccharide flippase family protein [Candidatus Daviesbacteria bacterium]|nr:oligosaccharide flippase family protein [Candidatus Daviesbacteria bacterium]
MESVELIDPTEKITPEIIKKRAVKGAAILTIRTILMQTVAFFANVLLTVFLEPSQYGVFFLVSAVINFLTYFSDIGFAAALIQKKENLTATELKTIFTTQQALVLILIIIIYITTPLIKNIYHLNIEAMYLLWALALSLFLSSLKIIPSVLMERRLEFNKLIIPQLIETVLFNVVVVFLAWKNFGINSFTIAVLVRGFAGLLATYFIQPWIPALSFSKEALKSILKFGIPYQINTMLAMIKDDGMTLYLGSILGPSGIGLLAWAQKWAFAPLRFFMDQVIKVSFPAFSRLQDNEKELSGAVSKSILYICLLVFPSLVMLLILAPSFVKVIPKYYKWSPALIALALLAINSALAAITTPITNTLNAIGKISVTFKFMIMWTVLTWVFVPFLALKFGVNGAAFGFTLVGLSSIIALILALKFVHLNYLQIIGKPLIVSTILGISVFIIKSLIPISPVQIISMIIGGSFVYVISIALIEPKIFDILRLKKNV